MGCSKNQTEERNAVRGMR
uniref:Uncharacterized protein n=1 Tax=Anguilla anguilla TaxID=7936 RepID=A0A0E9PET0_ANGAN